MTKRGAIERQGELGYYGQQHLAGVGWWTLFTESAFRSLVNDPVPLNQIIYTSKNLTSGILYPMRPLTAVTNKA